MTFLGLVFFPVIWVLLWIAALAEFVGCKAVWIWRIIGFMGGFSVCGWVLGKAKELLNNS